METRGEMKLCRWNFYIKFRSCGSKFYIFSSNTRLWRNSHCIEIIRHDVPRGKHIRIGMIYINDTDFLYSLSNPIFIEHTKQLKFCLHVVLHSLMEIKMILGNICEHCYIIVQPIHTIVVERM